MTEKTVPNTPAFRRIIEGAAASVTSGLILWWLTAPVAPSTPPSQSSPMAQPRVAAQPTTPAFDPNAIGVSATAPQMNVAIQSPQTDESAQSRPSIESFAPTQPPPMPATSAGAILLYEDFSRFREGDITDWGRDVAVGTGQDRRKWLVPTADGSHPVGRGIQLPSEFSLECRYFAGASTLTRGLLGWWKEPIASKISFVNEQNVRYTIDWVISCDSDTTRLNPIGSPSICPRKYYHSIKLPGGSATEVALTQPTGTLRITRDGGFLSVFLDGQTAASGAATTLGRLIGFEIHAVKAKTGTLSLTDFKIAR